MSLIEVKKKLLMAQKGGVDISEVFNTSLWTGTGAARTITTGIDSGEGSLVWAKRRNSAGNHNLVDTSRGDNNTVSSDTASAQQNYSSINTFTSSGYNVGTDSTVNASGGTYAGWQFRRAPKFFDIVQYAGNGVSGREISHNLGVAPGMIIVKRLDVAGDWMVWHRSTSAKHFAILNSTAAFADGGSFVWPSVPTTTSFFVGVDGTLNASGSSYIAYLIAHDADSEGIIQCGSYVGNGSSTGPVVSLGWRPQYLMVKAATTTGGWQIVDILRGFTATNDAILLANTSASETSVNLVNPSSTGFQLANADSSVNASGQTYIYMAIREAI